MNAPPLAELTVLDMSRFHPGAMCSGLLADMGADVIKIEAPGMGDGMRFSADGFPSGHVAYNRGKRSICVDTRNDAAPEVLKRLAAGVDVVIESSRPGSLDARGMGYDALRADNPRLVWCSISGFGPDGPNAAQPGHDVTYMGASGLLSQLQIGGEAVVADIVISIPFAALMAVSGILAAVVDRNRTGEGRKVDVNMVDSAMWVMAEQVARAASSPGPAWPEIASRAVYRCADGRSVTVASTEPRTWAAMCEGLDLPELADHQVGSDEAGAKAVLAERFATQPAAHWVASPGLAGGVGPLYEASDLASADGQVASGQLVPLEDGTPVLSAPIRFDLAGSDECSAALTPPPDLGADTDSVLGEFGFSEAEIGALRDGGVFGG